MLPRAQKLAARERELRGKSLPAPSVNPLAAAAAARSDSAPPLPAGPRLLLPRPP